eukprot:36555-Rhodomonas_salina.1
MMLWYLPLHALLPPCGSCPPTCYAMPGTEVSYGSTSPSFLRAYYAIPGTRIGGPRTSWPRGQE